MQYKIVFSPSASENLKWIQDYYTICFSKEVADNIRESIFLSISKLQLFPALGSKFELDGYLEVEGYRMLLSNQYDCIYKIFEEIIYIYYIVDTKSNYKKLFKKDN